MKNKEIAGLTDQELISKLTEEKAGLNKMKINHAVSPIENPLSIRLKRKEIARMKTEETKRTNKTATSKN
jgi:large subunit ribosomal protein L29